MTLTVVTIFLTFGSYRLSLITDAVAILSMGLSVLALAIFQYPFGIQALIGTIGSIGVSVNAAIIMLTALQKNPRAVAGGGFLSVVLAFFFTPAMFALLYAKETKSAAITDVAGTPQPAPLVPLASAARRSFDDRPECDDVRWYLFDGEK